MPITFRSAGASHRRRAWVARALRVGVASLACAVITACGDGHADANDPGLTREADHVPMLPGSGTGTSIRAGGTTDVNAHGSTPNQAPLAQRFGAAPPPIDVPASGGLLPPVMHTVD
ncbi:hypothetical protein [Trinickia fusca]|uniref:hypothetical protein n=1 Tax=Trinickia fusca TaxID=2419777 RepID=UPI0011C41CF2|nr:hypothetical protein [Trinickia fusca]